MLSVREQHAAGESEWLEGRFCFRRIRRACPQKLGDALQNLIGDDGWFYGSFFAALTTLLVLPKLKSHLCLVDGTGHTARRANPRHSVDLDS